MSTHKTLTNLKVLVFLLSAFFLLFFSCTDTKVAKGEKGEPGERGLQGEKGDPGPEGLSCWDLNSNRTCDKETEDKNGDGVCNALDCQGEKGDKGDQGPAGPQGPEGPPGKDGKDIIAPFKNVIAFGAKGDGIQDDTAAINSALVGGGDIVLPPGVFKVTSVLMVPENTTLRGSGIGATTLKMETQGAGATVKITGSNVTVRDLTIEGPSPSEVYVPWENGIEAIGASANQRLSNVRIINCEIKNYGFRGITFQYVRDSLVSQSKITRMGYAAFHCLSCEDTIVRDNFIDSVNPGTQGLAYGISFTYGGKCPNEANPVSRRCSAIGNIIRNIPVWSALDTHTGQGITFSNNRVDNCRLGIHAGGTECDQILQDISITGNTIIAGPAAHQHYGIYFGGKQQVLARNGIVANNIVDGYGIKGNDIAGAIQIEFSTTAIVSGNLVRNFAENGIMFYLDNTRFLCTGNHIDDGNTTISTGIRVRQRNNRGFISGNRMNGFGVKIDYPSDNRVVIGDNDNTSSF